ncbi:MAG: HAMP domain-containing sensor histidine kinase [Eubacteriales bacterium]|nr:HAMP domain-containing sensor histidine kinase [Eubacteriales bacterium]
MRRDTNKRSSIYLRLLKLLVAAFLISGAVFTLLYGMGECLVDDYYSNSDYIEKKNEKYIGKLQEYVRKNRLSTENAEELTEWVKKQRVLSVQVYKNNHLTYDSDYPDQEWGASSEQGYYEWESCYEVQFADGAADIVISGKYYFQFYTFAMVAELLLSFILFLGIVMMGIRRSMEYIRKLSSEIEILEGGNLEYEITVSGNDELAQLAECLDNMRCSFRDQVEKENYLVRANQKMITNMSHDLRTPLTSIMIYTEILKTKRYKDENQMQEYLDKIDRKTHRMKQLSDRIFEYSLVTSEPDIELEKPELFQTVFYDLLSETCAYLEQRGFRIVLEFQWEERKIRINPDYLVRILDNITSNIIKYAEASIPVKVCSVYTKEEAGISFENTCRPLERKEDSTGIGIRNMKNMMDKMNGRCKVEENGPLFKIILLFPGRQENMPRQLLKKI